MALALFVVLAVFYWQYLTGSASFYLADCSLNWHPFFEFIGKALRKGVLPLWNPYALCGLSQLAFVSPSPLYPFSLLFAVLPFSAAMATLFIINQLIAGIGMFVLLAAADWGVLAAVLASSAYALSSILFSLQTSCMLQSTAAWLPLTFWAFYSLGQGTDGKRWCTFAAASVLVFLLISPGVPEIFVPSLIGITVWCLVNWKRSTSSKSEKRNILLWQFQAMVCGTLLAMPMILPAIEWFPYSDRAWGLELSQILEWSTNWFDLIQLVLPHPLGDQQLLTNPFIGLTSDAAHTITRYVTSAYLGPILITLSVFGFTDKTWCSRWWILALAFCALILSMGCNCPLVVSLFNATHFHFFRYPIKLLVFLVMGIILAAARGLRRLEHETPRKVLICCAVGWAVVLSVAFLLQNSGIRDALLASAPTPLLGSAVSQIALDATKHVGFALMLCLLLADPVGHIPRRTMVLPLLIFTTVQFNLWQAAELFHHGAAPDFYQQHLQLKDTIDSDAKHSDVGGGYRINSVFFQEFDPEGRGGTNQTEAAYQYFRQMLRVPTNVDAQVGEPLGSVVGQTAESVRFSAYAANSYREQHDDGPLWHFSKLTATDYIVQPEDSRYPNGVKIGDFKPLNSKRFTLIARNEALHARVYKVLGALPRAYFASTVKWGRPHEEVLRFIAMAEQTGFDPAALTILEHNQPGEVAPSTGIRTTVHWSTNSQQSEESSPGFEIRQVGTRAEDKGESPLFKNGPEGTARFTLNDPEHIQLAVDTPRDNYLVLADTFYPGWRASVDSNVTPIYRANGMLRAIFVPRGKHTIAFDYVPASLPLSLALAALGVLTTLIGLFCIRSVDKASKTAS